MYFIDRYDVIVIGAGHAGCEAALAAARLGVKTLLCTINLDNIAAMPCNPAVGGPGKSHLVREIDALGGQMGLVADETAIQMRMLNLGKGPAVHSLRVQSDRELYHRRMKTIVENQEDLDVKQMMVTKILIENEKVTGILTELGEQYQASTVILATGTYLCSKVLMGEISYSSAPGGQRPSMQLSESLRELGIRLHRFKTGTPSRVDRRSLNFEKMALQEGDTEHHRFSFLSERKNRNQRQCWLTYTNEKTHQYLRENLHRAPMYTGKFEGVGARYCPSIEDKIVRFADKNRHQLFIEPEGLDTNEMYVQGMSTSMPIDVQYKFLATIEGLENVKIMRPAYAIEYDCLDPLQLRPTLELRSISGFFSAGQANGTSGYEEAAAQGLIAGINAARKVRGQTEFVLTRAEAYIGTLIDDLVTKGTNEPYRMMTSRSEYRLFLRQENADLRLTAKGYEIGLVTEERYQRFLAKKAALTEALEGLRSTILTPTAEINEKLSKLGSMPLKTGVSAAKLLKRPEISYQNLVDRFNFPTPLEDAREEIEITIKYEGYIEKQQIQINKARRLEEKILPADLDYSSCKGLSLEAQQKLTALLPRSLGQAARISGVSPADISVLMILLEQKDRSKLKKEK